MPQNSTSKPLEIIYLDENLVAINKPHAMLVHRSAIAREASVFAMQTLRDQLGRHVYPIHRIDRKTGGVLLFALNTEVQRLMMRKFAERQIEKEYLAIVRGYIPLKGSINYPLRRENGQLQEALTHYQCLAHTEIDVPYGRYNTSRYSLIKAIPVTGRMHQIRKHLAHIFHPIIADRPHGCNKQNKLFKQKWGMDTMMLHANTLTFIHPITKTKVSVRAHPQKEFLRMMSLLNFKYDYSIDSE